MCGFPLTFRVEGFRLIYALVAVFMWGISLMFSPRYFRGHHHTGRYYFFTVLTFAATVGVFLSDDFMTAFIFFEIMSFSSYPWVAQEETPEAIRAAGTYLAVAVLGGMVTLMGLFWLWNLAGTLSFDALRTWESGESLWGPAVLILTGYAAKAGVFPLHIWLPKAHPVAPAPASALLSGILTKAGIFGVIAVSVCLMPGDAGWGNFLLVLAGITMVLGALMAIFSTDLKHTLACSSMSQIGFILTGIAFMVLLGDEGEIAARGTFLHMLNHSLIKLDLFLCAGAVYMNTHSLNLTEVRGFGRGKPFLHFCFLMGYLGLIGMPLFSGYLSKSLLHEAILEKDGYGLYEKLFLFSGGMTAAYMTKLYLCLFHFKNRDEQIQAKWDAQKHYLSPASAAALGLAAVPPLLIGVVPNLTAQPLSSLALAFFGQSAEMSEIHWFSFENLEGAAISLLIGVILCALIHRTLVKNAEYRKVWPAWLDLENSVYRPAVGALVKIGGAVALCLDRVIENPLGMKAVPKAARGIAKGLEKIVENPLVSGAVPAAAMGLSGKLETVTDRAVVGLRHTVFRPKQEADYSISLAERAEIAIGEGVDRATGKHGHAAGILSAREKAGRVEQYLNHSVSFGLLMLSLGLCAFLVYLLL